MSIYSSYLSEKPEVHEDVWFVTGIAGLLL